MGVGLDDVVVEVAGTHLAHVEGGGRARRRRWWWERRWLVVVVVVVGKEQPMMGCG